MTKQLELLENFETAKPANPLYCHQQFLEKLAEHDRDAIGRRASFLLQRLAVDARRQHYKATRGVNRGWRRSRLGGKHGSHFYAWWAPATALPLKRSGGFASAPEGALFLRDIRHHDDHSLLTPQSLEDHYLPLSVPDLRRQEYGPTPWTAPQERFAAGRQPVRILKGHPGSGKTTALWNAADATGAERVLYVTYSRDLAALARDYFDRYCSSHKSFHVVTFPHLIRELAGTAAPSTSEHESRHRFKLDVTSFKRFLGAWTQSPTALYDELHAHLVGDAIPVEIGRFAACPGPRTTDKAYLRRRTKAIGRPAAVSALEAVSRLERAGSTTLAERYFPELALAWLAAERLGASGGSAPNIDPALLAFDCIAVDECQDLTPLETFVLSRLASLINRGRRPPVPLLLAGDEAQTVRPTDFEWGWLNDLLHTQAGARSEYKLSSNLRSPRRIAMLVNQVWDLYSYLDKQERPSGTKYAEIDDDATDQLLYGVAVPGPELDELLTVLSSREGLALITLDETVPDFVPKPIRRAVLTAAEAKGLDFHSVCVLDAGRHLERITHESTYFRVESDIEGLRNRLAIDRLRVAISRATERLIWLDINPSDLVVATSLEFLNGGRHRSGVASCVPDALLKTIEEDQFDLEERVQRCQADARQYLDVRPEIAWSRAQQAVTLLGPAGAMAAVTDRAARDAAYLTLAEICFSLGIRQVKLPAELGSPDLFEEGRRAAGLADRFPLGMLISAIGSVQTAYPEDRLQRLATLAETLPRYKNDVEPWLQVALEENSPAWIDELERAMFDGQNAIALVGLVPPFYEALRVPDREDRTRRLNQRAIQLLIKEKRFESALDILRAAPEPQPKLEATCYEGMGDLHAAAECYRAAGNLKKALSCYRSIPDFAAALSVAREVGNAAAAESLEWIQQLEELIEKRPAKFGRATTPAEKKHLEKLLERAVGVRRRKSAATKRPAKKTAPKKRASRKSRPGTEPFF